MDSVPPVFFDVAVALQRAGQGHVFDAWPVEGDDDRKAAFFEQVAALSAAYPGGIQAYLDNARRLLEDARAGVNPFKGYTVTPPEGVALPHGSEQFVEAEAVGVPAVKHCAFVLVAGGMGERLGFDGIKLALPVESTTRASFLQLYVESILALEARSGATEPCPLVIMTSDETHAATEGMLDANARFGAAPGQITLLRQGKVAALADVGAHLHMATPYEITTKPHGHGDVHMLLAHSGLLPAWLARGIQHVMFLQDTNALAFPVAMAALGVSVSRGLEINAVCLPRKAREAVGVIAVLSSPDDVRTANIEYSQLHDVLKAQDGVGDVNGDDGLSAYPGNTNTLIYSLPEYAAVLDRTGGLVPEFVNPKWASGDRTAFSTATRLECMMQDHSRMTAPGAKVQYTMFDDWIYNPCKNSADVARAKFAAGLPLHSAASAECAVYAGHCHALRAAGVAVPEATPLPLDGYEVDVPPRVVLHPSFVSCLADVRAGFPIPEAVTLTAPSSLVVRGRNVCIRHLDLDGAVVIKAVPGAHVDVQHLVVRNAGGRVQALRGEGDAGDDDIVAMRGFRIVTTDCLVLAFDRPGKYVVDDRASPALPGMRDGTPSPFVAA